MGWLGKLITWLVFGPTKPLVIRDWQTPARQMAVIREEMRNARGED